jgi:hypothetical protein
MEAVNLLKVFMKIHKKQDLKKILIIFLFAETGMRSGGGGESISPVSSPGGATARTGVRG